MDFNFGCFLFRRLFFFSSAVIKVNSSIKLNLPFVRAIRKDTPGNSKEGSITVPLTSWFDWFGISCMTTDNFCFYLQNRLFQTSKTGGQWYSDTSPFSIPCFLPSFPAIFHSPFASSGRLAVGLEPPTLGR